MIYVNSGHWLPAGMRTPGDLLPARQACKRKSRDRAIYSRKLPRVITGGDKTRG